MADDSIASDALFVLRAKVRQARTMSEEAKFKAGGDLFEDACLWSLAGMALRFPEVSAEARHDKLRKLMARRK